MNRFKRRLLALITAVLMLVAAPGPASAAGAPAQAQAVPVNTAEIIGQDDAAGTVTLRLTGPVLSSAPAGVSVPTWSEQNGQDDIIWHRAEKKADGWYVTIRAADHKGDAGTYHSHFYEESGGKRRLLCAVTYTLRYSEHPAVSAVVSAARAELSLQNAYGVSSGSEVFFAVWGAAGGQNDIRWYPAEKAGFGTWKASIDLKNHRETGNYYVHVYARKDGRQAFVAGNTFQVRGISGGTVSILNQDDTAGTFTVRLSGLSGGAFGVSRVLLPVWSGRNGQDDIRWYPMRKSGSDWYADIDYLDHKGDKGNYHIHAYAYDAYGTAVLAAAAETEVKAGGSSMLTAQTNADQTRITITLRNHPAQAGASIRFAVWGSKNGQNDLVWYTAGKEGARTYTASVPVSSHREPGSYIIHAYEYRNNKPGFVRDTTVQIEDISDAEVSVIDQDNGAGTFTVKIENLTGPAGIREVRVPVWSEQNGQDDIRWYSAYRAEDGDYYTEVNISDHAYGEGAYLIHAYAYDARGFSKLVGHTEAEFTALEEAPEVFASAAADSGSASVAITNLTDVREVLVPVWGDENGQNDIIWYAAKRVNRSTWRAEINIGNHLERGAYRAHVYACDWAGNRNLIGQASFSIQEVPENILFLEAKDDYGNFTATLSNVRSTESISSVSMAVWTSGRGQDDIRWNSAERTGGQWILRVSPNDHNGESGEYLVHVYANHPGGARTYLCGGSIDIKRKVQRLYQNPPQYYQVQDSIALGGGGYSLSEGYEGLKTARVVGYFGGDYTGMGGAYYSRALANKVRTFQQNHRLPVTGTVDLATWRAMGYSEYDWYHLGAYVSPIRVNRNSTRSDHIEAMIGTARTYLGTKYVIGASGAPGTGVDCSGLVMQAFYGAGLDCSPINPVRHAHPGYEYESANLWASPKLKHVAYSERQRGDLIFYQNAGGSVNHVAIYLGGGQVIESWPNAGSGGVGVVIRPIANGSRSNIKGVARPFV